MSAQAMMERRRRTQQRRWHFSIVSLTAAMLYDGRSSSLAFVSAPCCRIRQSPPGSRTAATAAARRPGTHPRSATCYNSRTPHRLRAVAGPIGEEEGTESPLGRTNDGKDDEKESTDQLWGIDEFYAQKEVREREMVKTNPAAAAAAAAAAADAAAEFAGRGFPAREIGSLRAAIAEERNKTEGQRQSRAEGEVIDTSSLRAAIADEKERITGQRQVGADSEDIAKRRRDEMSHWLAQAAAAAAESEAMDAADGDGGNGGEASSAPTTLPLGLGLEGGIFPSDVGESDRRVVTMKYLKLEPGQPEDIVGFWQVRFIFSEIIYTHQIATSFVR